MATTKNQMIYDAQQFREAEAFLMGEITPNYSPEIEAKFKDATEEMLYYIAQYEGFETEAYHGKADRAGLYTIGFGNTKHPNGKPIKPGDRITSAEQAKEYVYAYLKDTWTQMAQHLPVEQMTTEQIVAVADLMYNAGNNILANKPQLRQAITNYINNPSEQNKKYLVDLWNKTAITSDGKERDNLKSRRSQETMVFCGDLKIGLGPSSEYSNDEYLDLKSLAIGCGNIGNFGKPNSQGRRAYLGNVLDYRNNLTTPTDTVSTHINYVTGVSGKTVDQRLAGMSQAPTKSAPRTQEHSQTQRRQLQRQTASRGR